MHSKNQRERESVPTLWGVSFHHLVPPKTTSLNLAVRGHASRQPLPGLVLRPSQVWQRSPQEENKREWGVGGIAEQDPTFCDSDSEDIFDAASLLMRVGGAEARAGGKKGVQRRHHRSAPPAFRSSLSF